MRARYKVWLEPGVQDTWESDDYIDPELGDEPYWRRFRELVASLDAAGVSYKVVLDSDGGRDYALVTTMPYAAQLTLEALNELCT
jgi:hypothetical protein